MFDLIAKKNKAMEKGYQSYNILKNYILNKMKNAEHSPSGDECRPCYTPKEMLDILYSSEEYKNFVVDSLVTKKYCQIIWIVNLVALIVVTLAFGLIFTFVGVNILGIILAILVGIVAFLFFRNFKEGKTYSQYYTETMVKILAMSVDEYTITEKSNEKVINKDYINRYLDINYDKYSTKYNCKFESQYEIGDDFELVLKDVINTKDSKGNNITREENVFDGFSIVSKNKNPHNVLKGSVIKIREDHNLISSLIEDTVNSISQSKKDFSFNSEILNKHLDCKISNTGILSNIDDKMFEVTKIITPAFEERMLFLDERYNAFNMNISDSEFSFAVNMKKDTYQKFQSGELFKFDSNYKDKEFNTSIFSETNFEYNKLYPKLERLFLRKYFRVIYNYQMDSTRFNSYEDAKITKYENEIKEIMNMTWKEFSEINGDYVKNLKDEIDEKYKSISVK